MTKESGGTHNSIENLEFSIRSSFELLYAVIKLAL
jgi:hypothetical protein